MIEEYCKCKYLISPKSRQILLHQGYELTVKMNYCWFNRQEILQKPKEKFSKEKADKIKE